MRLVLIMDDDSCDPLMVPHDLDLGAAMKEWGAWYSGVFCPSLKLPRQERTGYISRIDWLIERCGCVRADVEEFWIP